MNPAQAMVILNSLDVRDHQAVEVWDENGSKYTWVIYRHSDDSYWLWSFGYVGAMYHGRYTKRRMADMLVNKFEGVTGG